MTESRDLVIENAKRIAYVEQCFGGYGKPLSEPGRILVGEGTVMKLCRKKPKPRAMFLFDDILVYGNIIVHQKLYNKQKIMHLSEVRISPVDDNVQSSLLNGIEVRSPSKSFIICTATPEEKVEWMRHIQKCIDDTLKRHGTKRATIESPVWVPDDNATVCMNCKQSEFTVLNRRHHCRKCGAVCCSTCTDKRWVLEYVSTKPVRVCRKCYGQLLFDRQNSNGSQAVSTYMSGEAELENVANDVIGQKQSQRSQNTEFYDESIDVN